MIEGGSRERFAYHDWSCHTVSRYNLSSRTETSRTGTIWIRSSDARPEAIAGYFRVSDERSHSLPGGYGFADLDSLPPHYLALAGNLEHSAPLIALILSALTKPNLGSLVSPCR